jgi:ubiquitin-protein ligase
VLIFPGATFHWRPNMRARRLAAEIKKLRDAPVAGVTVLKSEGDLGIWTACLKGPAESVYSGTDFDVIICTLCLVLTLCRAVGGL